MGLPLKEVQKLCLALKKKKRGGGGGGGINSPGVDGYSSIRTDDLL